MLRLPHAGAAAAPAGAEAAELPYRLRVLRALPLLVRLTAAKEARLASAPAPAPPPGADDPVVIYSDGACQGNPGPGGWAAIVIDGGVEREVVGGEPSTTNQRMELRAALEGLRAVPGRRRVALHSDSAYLINCFRDRWYVRWQANGWRNAQKRPVDNRDLWEALLAEAQRHEIAWHKVAGHSGVPLNDRADRLAVDAIRRGRSSG